MKKRILSFLTLFILVAVLATSASAFSSYATYTYSADGYALLSPDAYVPDKIIDANYIGLSYPFDDPRDLTVDDEENVYLVDGANNRVIVMDRYYKYKFELGRFLNEHGVWDSFNSPSGVFISDKYIYVCDTNNNRIVMFTRDGKYHKIIPKPVSPLFTEAAVYKPVAVAVDQYNRLFVVSSTTYQGIIVMDDNAKFSGFIGAQKVVISPMEIIWRRLQTKEQRESQQEYVSTEFNNITIDKDGFIYVTTSSIDENSVASAINSRSKSGDYAPVKKLNASGADIMSRNGFWPPSGEINFSFSSRAGAISGPSKIIDVAVGPEGTWSIIDEKRSKVFTYDKYGNLLFAFGDTGEQLGNIYNIEAITYKGDDILLLDKSKDCFTVYKRTEYGNLLIEALAHQNQRRYDMAVSDWMDILQRNSNFDAAYIGIGDALKRDAKYKEAMEYYKFAYNTASYSDAFREVRKEWVAKWIWTIPIIVVVICVLLTKFFKYAARVNKATQLKVGRKTLKEELLYGFHLIFHPFDGFWDLKHEYRGSVRAGIIYIIVTILSFYYQSIGTGYIFNPTESYMNIFAQIASVVVPLLLWVVANWCLTTLFDGEGSFKDIFIATSYSLLPIPMLVIPSVILSNILAQNEGQLITLLVSIAFFWMGILIFFGMMVTHDYSLLKNVTTSLGTIIGMGFIIFVSILFSTLVAQMVSFISSIIVELTYRA